MADDHDNCNVRRPLAYERQAGATLAVQPIFVRQQAQQVERKDHYAFRDFGGPLGHQQRGVRNDLRW